MNVVAALQFLLNRVDYTTPSTGANEHNILCSRLDPEELAACREALHAETIPVPEDPAHPAEIAKYTGDATPLFDAMGLIQPHQPPFPSVQIAEDSGSVSSEAFQGQGGAFGGAGSSGTWSEQGTSSGDDESQPAQSYMPPADSQSVDSSSDTSSSVDTSGDV